MRLVLHYRGPLLSNGGPQHKHSLRQSFHRQLRTLWHQEPLAEMEACLRPAEPGRGYSFLRPFGAFTFVPLATAEANTVVELDITLLRPEAPGGLVTQGGDIDNRLKSLLDALSMPPQPNALPPTSVPGPDEMPFFCLVEDDNLVVALNVRTEQLLEPGVGASDVDATITVRTRVTRSTIGNPLFA